MPALFTHYEYGQEVLMKLDKSISDSIKSSVEYYNMFNQGWDNLFYYLPRWNYYRHLAGVAHKKKIREFFYNLITYIKDNNLESNSDVTNMVYGFINHYTVDTIIHPLVNSEVKSLGIPHSRIEFMIDTRIRKNKKRGYFKTVIPRLKYSKELLNTIDYTFLTTHNYRNVGKIMNRSHNTCYYLYRYFISDNTGIKTFLYKIVDFITPFKGVKLNEITYYFKSFDERILNNKKKVWKHPSKEEEYNYSFKELYDICKSISLKLIPIAYNVINNKEDIDKLLNLIDLINIKNISKLLD